MVPESLPERLRSDHKISWTTIDPFSVCLAMHFVLMIDLILLIVGTTKYYSRSLYLSHLSYRFPLISSW